MPESKNQPKRIRIINDCLAQKGTYWSTDELLTKMADADLKVSVRTLRADVADMKFDSQLGYQAPIESDKAKGGYYYSDTEYSIDKLPLNRNDIIALEMAATTLKQYQYIPLMNEFNTTIEKIIRVVNRVKCGNYETILDFIEFEKTPIAIGLEHMDLIIEAIQHHKCLNVEYHSFEHDKAAEVTIHPYFIKEYRNRWYVIGLKDATNEIRIYAFDRIIKVEATDTFYKNNTHFANNDYLKNCIGIHQGSGKIEKVVLKFQPKDGKYVITQPLHRSQRNVEHEGREVIIELNVIINFELTGIILSYGAAVEVMEPTSLREKIRSIGQDISGLYTS
jgi:predicted DNA-binding transcriptional regulator YafY